MSLVVPLEEIFANKTKLLANHESWERINLGEVSTILNGFPFKSTLFNKSEGFPVIRIRDIANSSTATFYSGDFPSQYVVKKGDLLIGMDGNFRCCEWQGREAALNQRVCKITPNEKILDRKFLMFGLNGYLKAIEDVTSSVTVGHLSSRDVQRIPFPLPPLAEQRRIVAKLETVLSKVHGSRQRLAKVPGLLKRFRQSALAAACSGRLTADWRSSTSSAPIVPPVNIGKPEDSDCVEGWAWTKLTDLARLESGHTPRKTIPEYWEGGSVPWICLQDIRAANGKVIADTVLKPTLHGIDNSSARMLPAGTVVFSRDISVGYVTIMGREMATSQHFADWICGLQLDNRFLMYALMASRRHLMSSEQGSTVGTIYMPALKEFYVLKPPLPEQKEIVRRVDGLLSLADQLEMRLAKAREQVDKLTSSLLARAFRGELVPQDPNDEPAEKLLERIRGQKSSVGNPAPTLKAGPRRQTRRRAASKPN